MKCVKCGEEIKEFKGYYNYISEIRCIEHGRPEVFAEAVQMYKVQNMVAESIEGKDADRS